MAIRRDSSEPAKLVMSAADPVSRRKCSLSGVMRMSIFASPGQEAMQLIRYLEELAGS